jgi:TnpA family transposase
VGGRPLGDARWSRLGSDQVAGFAAVLVPGTVRDSLFILNGLLDNETAVQPAQVTTDTASYSDQIFGLFHLLGYQFSPRLADLADQRFWRIDRAADYGPLNVLSRHPVNTSLIVAHWEDILRLVASLATRSVRASDILRVTQGGGRPTALDRALAEYGRIPKTFHLLSWLDDPTYRGGVGGQLSLQESRHRLARKIFHGGGQLRQAYREGQEDQLGALGLVLNAVVLWNTRYMDAAIRDRRVSYSCSGSASDVPSTSCAAIRASTTSREIPSSPRTSAATLV